jgi:hypothetical protein
MIFQVKHLSDRHSTYCDIVNLIREYCLCSVTPVLSLVPFQLVPRCLCNDPLPKIIRIAWMPDWFPLHPYDLLSRALNFHWGHTYRQFDYAVNTRMQTARCSRYPLYKGVMSKAKYVPDLMWMFLFPIYPIFLVCTVQIQLLTCLFATHVYPLVVLCSSIFGKVKND